MRLVKPAPPQFPPAALTTVLLRLSSRRSRCNFSRLKQYGSGLLLETLVWIVPCRLEKAERNSGDTVHEEFFVGVVWLESSRSSNVDIATAEYRTRVQLNVCDCMVFFRFRAARKPSLMCPPLSAYAFEILSSARFTAETIVSTLHPPRTRPTTRNNDTLSQITFWPAVTQSLF